jgi:L-fuculokinase
VPAGYTDLYTAERMKNRLVLVLDCGATNIRAIAISTKGEIKAMHSLPNSTSPDPFYKGGLIWDVDGIWNKFSACTRKVLTVVNPAEVEAVTVTTFGVNGAPVDREGNLLYPVISWQCQRTVPVMENIQKYISPERLYEISGLGRFSFNTIHTLIWLIENHSEAVKKMHSFLFLPSIFIYRLTGQMVNDCTMAGTSMLTDIRSRRFSEEILAATGIPDKFSKLAEPGAIAGRLTEEAASHLGINSDIPVVVTGHDTQFALIGSGVQENEVVLSSGTWEILMTRTRSIRTDSKIYKAGVTNELDAVPGLYNTGLQWLASGILEWIKRNFYGCEEKAVPGKVYDMMIDEASKVGAGAGGIKIDTDFHTNKGSIKGLGINTTRGEVYRAALEALSEKTRQSLEFLQEAGSFKADSLIVVGGGSKNRLWNSLRANKLGIPVKLTRQSETTVLGASAFAFIALGIYSSVSEALKNIIHDYEYIYPGKQ